MLMEEGAGALSLSMGESVGKSSVFTAASHTLERSRATENRGGTVGPADSANVGEEE